MQASFLRMIPKHCTAYAGRFDGNGTSEVDGVKAEDCTVTRTGVGTISVTFADKHTRVLFAIADVWEAAGGDHSAAVIASSTNSITIETRATPTGAAADLTDLTVCFYAITQRDR